MPTDLPIESVIPELREALRVAGAAVLQAPPGAGKTTRVPLALLAEPWLAGQRIVMLEPRRLAARAAARQMARTLGEEVGGTVGFRVKMETRVGPSTRIEVVTEGVLTRMLQSDPALEGVGLVIFDEFHERSLHADLGLALTLQSRAVLRDDLRLLVMSATLDGAPVARLLGDAPVITSEGRMFPVEVRYLGGRGDERIEAVVARAVRRAVETVDGDVLVFLPGAAEIHRTQSFLSDGGLPEGVRILPLYGNLPQPAQDEAIAPGRPGRRKVVLSTAIAETSLTIEGVRVVIDSGLMRVPRFAPRTGMTRLDTVTVSRASSEQRCGRAGRLGPGVCFRLWDEHAQQALVPHGTPEILDADLAPLALELAAWGVADPAELAWLDAPPAAAFSQARELLAELGAIDAAGTITPHGRQMAGLPLHPRLAHMLLRADQLGLGALACDLAALLGERDVFRRGEHPADVDVRLRLEALRDLEAGRRARTHGSAVDEGGLRRVMAESRELRRRLRTRAGENEASAAGLLLAMAYPDRIGQRRGKAGRFLLRNGRGAAMAERDPLAGAPWIVAPELDGTGRESRVYLAASVDQAEIEREFAAQITTEEEVAWDEDARAVRPRRRTRLGALTLREVQITDADADAVAGALLRGIASAGIGVLPWSRGARQLQERMRFLHRHDATWPDVSDEALAAGLHEWLAPYVYGMTRLDDLHRLDLPELLLGMMGWERRAALDDLAPSHVDVPSGSRIPIDYSDVEAPVLAARLQELFGMMETPRIAGGRVPLTMHLLSPAHRPVQVTRDLGSFWKTGYFEVRKDLKGRYPKHYWPDDPLQAQATSRVRPRPG
ncbi:ATP-dependent helicase HrpB [Longimicrobium terrae]|uniref:ATP-dependent helicase HrpB n=1 Tax=Longimicrobium terrae TaxID=1639882 RepID=A0A841GVS0_9BACT|nr:ATP-dependent helicase HrpB [Longimicrobium terrae]MBB4635230.1 ATP-dependent helicase HrpB [Longimicrobium terrae]MBB6069624.1 ATP-dependent helicase HrpB [Longimicrobium terrae]NNC31575.1 ATP-dependent helicase HrpB [Longimicrobium terrae]